MSYKQLKNDMLINGQNSKLFQLADEYVKAGYFKKKSETFMGMRMTKGQVKVMEKISKLLNL
jgi:hypothetical protein